MKLHRLAVETFRNFESSSWEFGGDSWFVVGANGLGKTNLLEAIYLLAAFRSFRSSQLQPLLQWGASNHFGIHYRVEHEEYGEVPLQLDWEQGKSRMVREGEDEPWKLSDYLGRFPVVALTSEDVEFVRGAPAHRRRQMDLHFSMLDPEYFEVLQVYHRGLRQRNALLRQGGAVAAQFVPFEQIMASSAHRLGELRETWTARWSAAAIKLYREIAPPSEPLEVLFSAGSSAETMDDYLALWGERRDQDREMGMTTRGPHRADWKVRLKGHPAREFASEGQQRGIVLCLRLALFHLLSEVRSIAPILVADDVLHELDERRRRIFWEQLPTAVQVFASGTSVPHEWEERIGRVLPMGGD